MEPSVVILPEPRDYLVNAVQAGGGVVAPLSEATRGLVLTEGLSQDALETVLAEHPGIAWIQLPLAGVDQYEDLMQRNPDRQWTSGKGAFGQPVGEFALALVLALLRSVDTFARAQSWGKPQGTSLHGKRVVIVGAGGVGREILRLVSAFTEHITIVRAHRQPVPGAEKTVTDEGLDDALREADVLVLAAPMTAGTEHLLDARRLALLRPDAFLVNIARGPLVETAALVTALAEGKLAGAALDVTDPQPLPDGHPLWSEPRALITPHTGETQDMIRPLFTARVERNVRNLAAGFVLEGLVDVRAGY
ncbi:NAD(P)-dependent oxidoreductase [Arthrobacter sp. zg-Y750]|uniref:NAD(P)-dependent oxidoreductase n=1 Tax=Arthrobacter sp. zg-Y750 TaxID=2894189 RepID=UPI001E3C4E6B|nr:NAD(P)-dependent oxidoreductase [Arthrobacter sp. zg-Y750]MCC9178394.1 hydroxyacid dehydrogenase [Arthrobacter sp. zg-Y750]